MSKKNVYLVDLGSGSNMNLLPLAIGVVGSYSASQPEISESYNFEYRILRQNAGSLASSMINPTIVGFSCYVWNLRGSLTAARTIKKIFPDTLIVLGGFSVPKRLERIKCFFENSPFVDVLIHGEGELAFANILREVITSKELQNVKGITYRTQDMVNGFVSNPHGERVKVLDDIPSPFLNGLFDSMLNRYGSAITGTLWETNRGCPYSCTYCDWGNSDVSQIIKYSLERLNEEIKWISRNKFFYMFITDANFGIFSRRDLQIAKWIGELSVNNGFPRHVVTNWPKNSSKTIFSIANELAKNGVACNVTMAIQSRNKATLKAIKRKNIKEEDFFRLKKQYHDWHIPTYMEVILGLPLETYDSFVDSLNHILTYRVEDRFFVYLCQMLENAELDTDESRKLYQIETRLCRHTVSNRQFDWNDDTTEYEEFVVGTSTMSINEWGKAYVVGCFLTVLYNHRVAFFVMIFLNHQFKIKYTDFIEYIIDKLENNINSYQCFQKSIGHIYKQRQLVLDSVSTMTCLPSAEDIVVPPHVGALILIVEEIDQFYDELYSLTTTFCKEKGIDFDSKVFNEIIQYQKGRMPRWPTISQRTISFKTNIPEYFYYLNMGEKGPCIVKKPLTITVRDHHRDFKCFREFAATLVRGGLTVDLLDVTFEDANIQDISQERDAYTKRREMEQNSIKKLKQEYDKISRQ